MNLARFVSSLSYKPGWTFKLAGPGSRFLCVYALTVDSQNPSRDRLTQHQFEIPAGVDQKVLCRWVLDQLLKIERHEACEFLRVDGRALFFPIHNTDEGSPYEHVERWETP